MFAFFKFCFDQFFVIHKAQFSKEILATINDKCFPGLYYILKNLKWSSDKSLNFYISKRKEKANNHYGT